MTARQRKGGEDKNGKELWRIQRKGSWKIEKRVGCNMNRGRRLWVCMGR